MQDLKDYDRQKSLYAMDSLIDSIKKIVPSITEETLAKRMGYNEGYISQCRSRGFAPRKFILALMNQKLQAADVFNDITNRTITTLESAKEDFLKNSKRENELERDTFFTVKNKALEKSDVKTDDNVTIQSLARSMEIAQQARLEDAISRRTEAENTKRLIRLLETRLGVDPKEDDIKLDLSNMDDEGRAPVKESKEASQ